MTRLRSHEGAAWLLTIHKTMKNNENIGQGCNVNGEGNIGEAGMARVVKLRGKGKSIPGHTHNFGHTTFFMVGSIRVIGHSKEGEQLFDKTIDAPNFMVIDKDIRHELIAETDYAEAWCVFCHRDKDGNVVPKPV